MATELSVRIDGATAWLRLEGEDRLNAIGTATAHALAKSMSDLESDRTVRAVVLHGAGRAFCAGADIDEINGFAGPDEFASFVHGFTDALDLIAASRLPVVAAIHGAALGGGLELAMACDLRIATDRARLGLPEAKLGVLPGAAGTQRLPRLVPAGIAAEMLFLGEPLGAERAFELGLINRVTTEETLLDIAAELAGALAAAAPRATAAAKQLLRAADELPLTEGIAEERRTVSALFGSVDGREGFRAFTERRAPTFTGE